jgi:hypothetical protein
MAFTIVLPNPYDLEGERILLGEEFETEDEALEWAMDMLGADEEGKIQVIHEYIEDDDF